MVVQYLKHISKVSLFYYIVLVIVVVVVVVVVVLLLVYSAQRTDVVLSLPKFL